LPPAPTPLCGEVPPGKSVYRRRVSAPTTYHRQGRLRHREIDHRQGRLRHRAIAERIRLLQRRPCSSAIAPATTRATRIRHLCNRFASNAERRNDPRGWSPEAGRPGAGSRTWAGCSGAPSSQSPTVPGNGTGWPRAAARATAMMGVRQRSSARSCWKDG